MTVIYHHALKLGQHEIEIHPDARILGVLNRNEEPTIYYEWDQGSHFPQERTFLVVNTGETYPDENPRKPRKFLGTCVLSGWRVVHVFEEPQ